MKSAKWPQAANEFPPAALLPLSTSPRVTCENLLAVVILEVPLIQFVIAHLLCSRLSLHLPAYQTSAAAMFPGLEATSMFAAQGKREGRAEGEAVPQSDWGSPGFLLPSTVTPLGRPTERATYCILMQATRKHLSITLEDDTFHTSYIYFIKYFHRNT